MNLAEKYVAGLKKAYYERGGEKKWNHFEDVMYGAKREDMEKLKTLYPDIPSSLLQLLICKYASKLSAMITNSSGS